MMADESPLLMMNKVRSICPSIFRLLLLQLIIIGYQRQHNHVYGLLPNVVKIGGLFENGDELVEMAFRDAVARINSDETLLPQTRIEPIIERLEPCDSFQASKRGI